MSNILSILIDLATVTYPYMLDEIAFHGKPIAAESHNFLGRQRSTGMGSKQAFMRLFHQMVSLKGIYASKQSCVMVPFVQDFPIQEKLARHVPNEFLFTIYGPRQVSTIFNISLDIMVPWLSIDFSFDVHAFFDIHAVGRHATDLYAQLLHFISFC